MLYPKSVCLIGGLLLLIIALTPLFYFHIQEQEEIKAIQDSTSFRNQKNAIIQRLRLRVPIPEPPKMLTVIHKETMKNLPFYEIIQNGDKMLIFPKAKIGVIYNPKTDIVNAIVDISDPTFDPYERLAR